ncbi:MAG TPA: (2Fe-2S)-binding protein [Arenicellales bacterium]|nr:(2Fe-2S)-binding protein [Acidiferrobacteraceae bacterium]MDP6138019.1 (2Fe-2S)-binding protein [Arenicellales bacterium]MDP7218969.1 (2Fe-2S)-binding protein [Arenicellales bacterium]HJP09952.1 (2Fe-2S)-binding protein [Arenicellales bacterium]
MTELRVNGQVHEVQIKPHDRLSDVLREKLGLYGVRVSCAEGECGSCTVLIDGQPVTACLVLAMKAEGREVTTIEGLGTPDDLHPIQEALIEEQGFQCGFCTPGIAMVTKAFLDRNPDPSEDEVASAVSGNICRCGAYPYIVRSVLTAARKLRENAVVEDL